MEKPFMSLADEKVVDFVEIMRRAAGLDASRCRDNHVRATYFHPFAYGGGFHFRLEVAHRNPDGYTSTMQRTLMLQHFTTGILSREIFETIDDLHCQMDRLVFTAGPLSEPPASDDVS